MTVKTEIIELDGKIYRVDWVQPAIGKAGARISVQVKTSSSKLTWRSLNGHGRANRLNQARLVLALATTPFST